MPNVKSRTQPMKDMTGFLTEEQIERIIAAAKTPRERLLLLLLSQSGRRISEIVGQRKEFYKLKNGEIRETGAKTQGIRPMDINFETGEITFTILKTRNVQGLSVITLNLLKELEEYIRTNKIEPNQPLFGFSRQRAYQLVRRCAERAGINAIGQYKKPVRPHHFRHSFAVTMARDIKDTMGLAKIKNALGHADVNTTMWYVEHFNTHEMREMVERIWGK